jgi:peptidoglycan/xylan/chitin deacetylase (PgdA/CDA1 family)
MNQKIAYLTIDDAPTKDFRKKVDFLINENIPAIFFCLGKEMKKFEDDLVYAIQKGFVVGSHAFSHRYFSDLSLGECFEEIKKTDVIIEELYKKAGVKRPIKLFRFPYLDKGGHKDSKEFEENPLSCTNPEKKRKIQEYLQKMGYRQPKFENINLKWYNDAGFSEDADVVCTFDQMEYWLGRKNAPYGLSLESAIMARIEEDFPEDGRSLNSMKTSDIIMVHDHERTTALFFKIIKRYLEKGILIKFPEFGYV